jgi:hypothetical protein
MGVMLKNRILLFSSLTLEMRTKNNISPSFLAYYFLNAHVPLHNFLEESHKEVTKQYSSFRPYVC